MTLQIILIFQAIQAFSLMVIALGVYNIWRKIEWEPNISTPVREDFEPDTQATKSAWKEPEKKFRAKVYEE